MCVKCRKSLERLRIRVSNDRGGKKAGRILERFFFLLIFFSTWIGCLKPTIAVVILKPTPFCGINRIPSFCDYVSPYQFRFDLLSGLFLFGFFFFNAYPDQKHLHFFLQEVFIFLK